MSSRTACGHGLATLTDEGQVLDTWYPAPALGGDPARPGRGSRPSPCRTRRAACAARS